MGEDDFGSIKGAQRRRVSTAARLSRMTSNDDTAFISKPRGFFSLGPLQRTRVMLLVALSLAVAVGGWLSYSNLRGKEMLAFDTVFRDISVEMQRGVSRSLADKTNATTMLGLAMLLSVNNSPLLYDRWPLFESYSNTELSRMGGGFVTVMAVVREDRLPAFNTIAKQQSAAVEDWGTLGKDATDALKAAYATGVGTMVPRSRDAGGSSQDFERLLPATPLFNPLLGNISTPIILISQPRSTASFVLADVRGSPAHRDVQDRVIATGRPDMTGFATDLKDNWLGGLTTIYSPVLNKSTSEVISFTAVAFDWSVVLAATLPDYFKLTAVVTHVPQPGYAPSSFSFKCANGVITLLGPGDLHRDTVDTKLRVVALQVGGSNLTLSLYPDKDYFDSYFSLYPAYQIIGACIALVIITGIFVVYDRIVRNHFDFLRKQKEQIRIRAERAAAQQKSEFVTMVSHEIRTPLNVIAGATALLSTAQTNEEKTELLDMLSIGAKHVVLVIEDIINIGMLDGGMFTIIPEACHLVSAVVEPASRMAQMSPQFKEKSGSAEGFSLTVTLGESLPQMVVLDASRVAQILTNLLDNAVKFTPPGGKVELVVEWNEPEGQQAGQGGNRRPPVSSVHTSAKRWVNVLHTSEEAADTERGANPDSSLVAGSDASASLEAPAGNPEHERRNSIWKPVSLLNRFLGAGIRLAPGHGPVHSGSHIVFRVCDTGIGVPPHQMERIFQPFVQADTASNRQYQGTGLGLTICRKVAHAMNGTLTLSSKVGEGSEFTLTIPVTAVEEGPHRRTQNDDHSSRAGNASPLAPGAPLQHATSSPHLAGSRGARGGAPVPPPPGATVLPPSSSGGSGTHWFSRGNPFARSQPTLPTSHSSGPGSAPFAAAAGALSASSNSSHGGSGAGTGFLWGLGSGGGNGTGSGASAAAAQLTKSQSKSRASWGDETTTDDIRLTMDLDAARQAADEAAAAASPLAPSAKIPAAAIGPSPTGAQGLQPGQLAPSGPGAEVAAAKQQSLEAGKASASASASVSPPTKPGGKPVGAGAAPLAAGAAGGPGADAIIAADKGPPLKILVCEDEKLTRTLVTRILQKFRSTVETAENGAIGVEIFKKNKGDYSCVLMDINMPVMDGLQATVEMRKLMAAGECKRIPVLALSASCSDEEIARCRVAGMACHISKPMNLGFFQVIRKIVEEHEKKVEEGEAVGALPLVSSAALAAERRETKRESSKRESDVAGAAQQGAGSPAYLEGTVSRRSAFQHTTLFDGSAVGALRSSTSDAPR